jgi:hypothetical protein
MFVGFHDVYKAIVMHFFYHYCLLANTEDIYQTTLNQDDAKTQVQQNVL